MAESIRHTDIETFVVKIPSNACTNVLIVEFLFVCNNFQAMVTAYIYTYILPKVAILNTFVHFEITIGGSVARTLRHLGKVNKLKKKEKVRGGRFPLQGIILPLYRYT